jgi:RND family efflux transporter MFP subunit
MRTSISFVAVIVVGSLASACARPEARGAGRPGAGEAGPPVKTHTVAAAPAPPAVRYSASIEAREQVSLAFKTSGYIDLVLRRPGADGRSRVAQPGDRVARGAVLARVQETDYRERVNQGKAKLAEGEASLVKARLDLARARTLFESQSLTKPELDAAQASFDAAEARIAAARADLELTRSALADCALVAPASGVILERRIELGTLAAAGTVGFVIGDLSSVKARFGIPDGMVGSIALGDAIGVIVEGASAAPFAGRVTAVAPAADPQSRVFDVEVTIPNTDGRLRPGMIGTVSVAMSPRAASAAVRPLTVPLTAVVRSPQDAKSYAVMVVEPHNGVDVARIRRVALGDVMGNAVAVVEGLAAGDRVVASGATLLADGSPVRVIPE